MRLTMFFLLFAFLVSPTLSFAHGGSHGTYQRSSPRHSTGPNYGGGHHTVSHGGHYTGGSGSSHRGGHYVNPKTGNHYGHHK